MKDWILNIIEQWSGLLHLWAWNKRRQNTDQETWTQEYREWKKKKCPHN